MKDEKKLSCTCGRTFLRQHSFEKHQQSHHTLKKCKFCSSTFDSNAAYLDHIETFHLTQKHSFMCSACGKQYRTKMELTHHINSKCGTFKQFKCKICGQELMSPGSLYNHVLRHKGQRRFMCRFCAKLFFTAGQLKVHERIHTRDKAYVCEVCHKGFCHRQSLITHSTLHTGVKPFQCENCGNSFSCVGNLIKHRKTHSDTCGLVPLTTHRVENPSTKIKVRINTPANSRLKTREKNLQLEQELDNLKTEISKTESGENKLLSEEDENSRKEAVADENCDSFSNENVEEVDKSPDLEVSSERKEVVLVINVVFDDKAEADKLQTNKHLPQKLPIESSHTSDTHQPNIDLQSDPKTAKKPPKKDPDYEKQLDEFIRQTNFNKEGSSDCKYCGKKYTNVRWLFKHVKDHESNLPEGTETAPKHKCSCCKLSFLTREENLAHQQAAHADVLTCQECDKIFANRDSLRSHRKAFHGGVRRKSYLYICDRCGKQFKQKAHFKWHEERNCDKEPSFECSICQRRFSSRHTRDNHMRVHQPEKKFLCKFCAKSFHWKGQLKIHERSHTGEKPFACLYCPRAFAYRESLVTHSTIHTGIKPHLCESCGSRFSCIGNLIKHRASHSTACGLWTYKGQRRKD